MRKFELSTNMQTSALHDVVAQLARRNVPVLISGEPGVGKRATVDKLCATALPSGTELIDVDCSDIEESSLMRLLHSVRENSEPRVLCLERVDAMSSTVQRVLQTEIDPTLQSGHVFLVCIANVDLDMEVLAGRFREDLCYKISPFTIRIAPLRHRKDEIVPLADEFLSKYALMFGRPKQPMTTQLLRFLHEHSWPGNLPELENAMRTVAAVGDPKVAIAALSATTETHRKRRNSGDPVSLKHAAKAASSRAERELILSVLSGTNWNRKKAAKQLQISYKALLYKMKQIGVAPAGDVHQEVTEG